MHFDFISRQLSTMVIFINSHIKLYRHLFLFLIPSLIIQSCSSPNENDRNIWLENFYNNTSSLEIILAYEEGACNLQPSNKSVYSNAIESSLTKLLKNQNISVSFPKNKTQMTSLGSLEQNNYSRQNIINLASKLQVSNKGNQSTVCVLILDGYYIQNTRIQKKLLGINLNNTSIIAIFKPAIQSSSSQYAEQVIVEESTILHEIGHALGLTNNGIQSLSNHEDLKHKAHCSDKTCVMSWQTCGGNSGQKHDSMATKKFCIACLADIKSK